MAVSSSKCNGNTNDSAHTRGEHDNGCGGFLPANLTCVPIGHWRHRLDDRSRMNREVHVRFLEGVVVRFRWATQLSRFYIYIVSIFSLEGGLDGFPLRVPNEALSSSRYITLGEWPRLSSTARVERAHSDCARSASKEGTWRSPSHLPKLLSTPLLVVPICSSISDCKCRASACQSSVV
jgi:hypothetical protein